MISKTFIICVGFLWILSHNCIEWGLGGTKLKYNWLLRLIMNELNNLCIQRNVTYLPT